MQFDFSEEAVRRRLEELTRDNEVQALMKVDSDNLLSQVALRRRLEDFTLDSEVQLLLDGIPEIQFGDDTVSDDLVDHLLQLGGKPPSQLQLPTAQINQHEVLKMLQDVTKLRISLKNLSIFSARYGVRKEGTFITVKTPNYYEISLGKNPYHVEPNPDYGDHLPMNDSKKPKGTPFMRRNGEEIRFSLKELQALEDPQPSIRRNDKKDSIKKFFLGDCDLHHTLTASISITDRLLQDWMRNENLIEIAMFGFVAPPGTQLRGISLGPSCYARGKINPISLLTCSELDAMVNLDLIADKPTLSDVTQRMQLLLAGTRMKPLSDRMGVLSVRLTLLPENEKTNEKAEKVDVLDVPSSSSREEKNSFNEPVRLIPSEISLPKGLPNIPQFVPPEDSALLYTPHQSPETEETTHFLTTTPAEMLRTALDRQPKPLPPKEIFLGIAVFAMTGSVITDSLRNILRGHPHPHPDDSLCLRFKISKDRTDVLRIPLTHCQPDQSQPDALVMPLGKLVSMKERLSHPPFLEVWVELKTLDDPYEMDNAVSHRHLLAWSSRKTPVLFHQVTKLQLLDPTTMQSCGSLFTVFYQHEYPYFIEEKLQQQLDTFKLPQPMVSSVIKSTDISQKVYTPQKPTPTAQTNQDLDHENEKDTEDVIQPHSVEKVEDTEWMDETLRPRSDSLVSEDSLGDSSGEKSQLFPSTNNSQLVKESPADKEETASSHLDDAHHPSSLSETFVLDIVPHGISSVFASTVPSSASPTSSMTMGCFVCYALPGISTESKPAEIRVSNTEGTRVVHFPKNGVMRAEQYMFSLWWDADCAILNGRNRHTFALPTQPSVTVYELARVLGVDAHVGLEFYIVGSDLDGNLLRDDTYLSYGKIPLEVIVDCFNNNHLHENILTIPLTANSLSPTNDKMLPLIPVELQLRLSWRRESSSWQRLSKQTGSENTFNHTLDNSLPEKSLPIIRKEELQPLPLEKAIPFSFHEEFCLPTYSVTVLALHHLKLKPLDLQQSHPNHHCELIYSLQHAGDIMAANVPANIHKILDKIAYPENFRVTSSAFPGQSNARLEVVQHHRVQTPIRRSTLLQEIVSPVISLVDNSLAERNALFCAIFSGLGALTLSLYERHSLFPTELPSASTQNGALGLKGIVQATDALLGIAVVDLDVMLRGLPVLEGWYNLVDSVQTVVGQVLLRVEPLQIDSLQNRYQTQELIPSKTMDTSGMLDWPQRSFLSEDGNHPNNMTEHNASDIFAWHKREPSATRTSYDIEKETYEDDEGKLLDITGMEKDALEIMLADLEATKERLLESFGMKPTLIEKNSEDIKAIATTNMVSPAPTASDTEYSSDFESLPSSASDEENRNLRIMQEEQTVANVLLSSQQHGTINFTADLDAAASPMKVPVNSRTSFTVHDPQDAVSSFSSENPHRETTNWSQLQEVEHQEMVKESLEKEHPYDEDDVERDGYDFEEQEYSSDIDRESGEDHNDDSSYHYEEQQQQQQHHLQQISETSEDIEMLRTAPTPPSSASFAHDTAVADLHDDTETAVLIEKESMIGGGQGDNGRRDWAMDHSSVFPVSIEAQSTVISIDKDVPDQDDTIQHIETHNSELHHSSMQLDSILDLLQYHHHNQLSGDHSDTAADTSHQVQQDTADGGQLHETVEFSQSDVMDQSVTNEQKVHVEEPVSCDLMAAHDSNLRPSESCVNDTFEKTTDDPQGFSSVSIDPAAFPPKEEEEQYKEPVLNAANSGKSFSAEEDTIHISFASSPLPLPPQVQVQPQSAVEVVVQPPSLPVIFSPTATVVTSELLTSHHTTDITDNGDNDDNDEIASPFPHLQQPSSQQSGSHLSLSAVVSKNRPSIAQDPSLSVSVDTATSPIRVIFPSSPPVSISGVASCPLPAVAPPQSNPTSTPMMVESQQQTLCETPPQPLRSLPKPKPSPPQSVVHSGVNLEALLPAQVLRRIIPTAAAAVSSASDKDTHRPSQVSSHGAATHSAVRDMATLNKHRRKMDEETERIARIMRGKLSAANSS